MIFLPAGVVSCNGSTATKPRSSPEPLFSSRGSTPAHCPGAWCAPAARVSSKICRELNPRPRLLDEGEHAGDAFVGVGSGDMVGVAVQDHEPRLRNQQLVL